MKTVTTTEAKAKLNSLLTEVDAGETITVPEDFNEPMSDEDLALWGEGE